MVKKFNYYFLNLILFLSIFSANMIVANSQFTASVSGLKHYVPLATDVVIYTIDIKNKTSTINMELNHIKIERQSGLGVTNYESITIYQDGNNDEQFTSDDLSNITAQIQNPTLDTITLSADNTNNFRTIELGNKNQMFFLLFVLLIYIHYLFFVFLLRKYLHFFSY